MIAYLTAGLILAAVVFVAGVVMIVQIQLREQAPDQRDLPSWYWLMALLVLAAVLVVVNAIPPVPGPVMPPEPWEN